MCSARKTTIVENYFLCHSAVLVIDYLMWGNDLKRFNDFLASGFGAGYLPWAPGTWGSLEAVFLVVVVHQISPSQEKVILGTLLFLLILPAIFFSGKVAQSDGNSDPSRVVIDEIVGQIFCLLWVPVSPKCSCLKNIWIH